MCYNGIYILYWAKSIGLLMNRTHLLHHARETFTSSSNFHELTFTSAEMLNRPTKDNQMLIRQATEIIWYLNNTQYSNKRTVCNLFLAHFKSLSQKWPLSLCPHHLYQPPELGGSFDDTYSSWIWWSKWSLVYSYQMH